MKNVVKSIKYQKNFYSANITSFCVDLKMVAFLLRLQSGYYSYCDACGPAEVKPSTEKIATDQ